VKPIDLPEPWNPGQATDRIRDKARQDGFVYTEGVKSDVPTNFIYEMQSFTPSSERREVAVVVIPSYSSTAAKIVTVMWVDEPRQSG
jgi:hypothetical protein